jgi:putative ABC transport system permease protein
MLKSYFKTGWRILKNSKFFSAINICGLAVGMAVALLIGLWIQDELNFNRYHKEYKVLGRILQNMSINGNIVTQSAVPMPLGHELKENYKENFKRVCMVWWPEDHMLHVENKKLVQLGSFMEAGAPEMFTLEMLKGTQHGLDDMKSILLSASTAHALFGDEDPMGRMMKIDNRIDVKVTGVYKDLPNNSEFEKVKFISSWDLWVASNSWMKAAENDWGNNSFSIYVQLNPGKNFEDVSASIRNSKLGKLREDRSNPQLFVHPMSNWHLYNEFKNGKQAGGAIETVWLIGVIGVFVLLLACINFMNLSTARSEKRSREVGIRKTLGSARAQLVRQFLAESLLFVFLSFLVALIIVVLTIPAFNQLADKEIRIPWTDTGFWLISLTFIAGTSLVSGSYPALYLSSFNPLKVLKGSFHTGRLSTLPRKLLVILQFTVSVALIIGTIVVFRQVQAVRNRPIGYSRDGLVLVRMMTPDFFESRYDVIRRDLIASGAVTEMAESSSPTFQVWSNNSGFNWEGKDPNFLDDFATIAVTHDFGRTVGWEIVRGRDFSRDFATDSSAVVLNESAVKVINLKDPIGATITWNGRPLRVIGIIKDMVMESAFEPAKQTIFFLNYDLASNWMNMRLNPNQGVAKSLQTIEAVFGRLMPAVPFDYKFADHEYAQKFLQEERIAKLARVFAILAIFISCLGVFGLAAFVAERKTKEIGIRKVLGASVLNVWGMLSKDFTILVGISCIIAMPIAYYYLQGWLQQYTYRTTLKWWIFAAAIGGALLVTILTVSFQAIKAAIANPVKSLRNE